MPHEEMSFCELRNKEIVNETDGRRLGRTCDLIFSLQGGRILGIVAPFNKRGLFFRGQEVFIPFKNIIKIGPDVVLVRLTPELSQPDSCMNMDKNERPGRYDSRRSGAESRHEPYGNRRGREYYDEEYEYVKPRPEPSEREPEREHQREHEREFEGGGAGGGASPDCDFRCEKCMLFDCNKRWKGGQRQKKRPPPRGFDGETGGSAYVDGKLYEANER